MNISKFKESANLNKSEAISKGRTLVEKFILQDI